MAKGGLVWLSVGAALLTGACSNGDPATSRDRMVTTQEQGHVGRFAGDIARSHSYGKPGITMSPPPASLRPDVSWTAALHGCFTGPVECVTHGDAVVSVAVVTGPEDAVVNGRRLFDHAMAYVVVWDSSSCVRLDLAGEDCHVVNLITAKHGNVDAGIHAYTFEIPDSSPVPTA